MGWITLRFLPGIDLRAPDPSGAKVSPSMSEGVKNFSPAVSLCETAFLCELRTTVKDTFLLTDVAAVVHPLFAYWTAGLKEH
jgi:hypothetical protein